MAYYRTCPLCGAALDLGEKCDCMNREGTTSEQGENKEKAAPVLEHRDGPKTEPQPHDSALILPGGGRRSQV